MLGACASGWAQGPASEKAIERFNLSTGGTGLYRPERWGMIKVSLRNPQDHDVQLLVTTHLESDPRLQYGRRIWMPPHSRAVAWHPIRMPKLDSDKQDFFDLRSFVLHTADGAEAMATNEVGSMQFDQGFRVAHAEVVTAAILDSLAEESPGEKSASIRDFILTARYDRGLPHNFTSLSDPLLPASEELYDAVDQLIIASDRIRDDGAGIAAVRRWVSSGGNLWIMADRISPELLVRLLGDDDAMTEVDRVELSSVRFEPGPRLIGGLEFERDLEIPARFVRLLTDSSDVEFFVNGWPAAIQKSYGAGRILITTLGADAWVRPRTEADPPPPSGRNFQTQFVSGDPLSHLSVLFFSQRPAAPLTAAIAEPNVEQLIGYSIPSRGVVLGTLGAFTLLIVATGLWALRLGRLELVGLVIPGLSLAAAGVLVFAGWTAQSSVPASTAILQHVQAVPGTATARSAGTMAVFSNGSRSPELSSHFGGWALPDMSGLEGTTRRLIWTDLDTWSWDNLALPPGLRLAPFQSTEQLANPVDAVAQFGPEGIHGRLLLPEKLDPADAILWNAQGRMGLSLKPDGTFEQSGVLGNEEYLSAGVLTDEQQRRIAVLREFQPASMTSDGTNLLVWTRPWPMAASLVPNLPSAGSALVTIPVRWERPAPGMSVTIPEPFLVCREVRGPDGLSPTGLFDSRTLKWLDRTGKISSWLGFQVPEHLLPLSVRSATITFKVQGPLNRLELSRVNGDASKSVHVWTNPVGTLTHELTDPAALELDTRGRLLLRVDVGNRPGTGPAQPLKVGSGSAPADYWKFETVTLRLVADVASAEPQP